MTVPVLVPVGAPPGQGRLAPFGAKALAVLATPAVAIFISSNIANAGNMLFNLLFSRWMGPALFADLATLLTLKLSLLAVLNAVQMAVSQEIATPRRDGTRLMAGLAWLNGLAFVALGLALPFLVPAALTEAVAGAFGLEDGSALALLVLALPFTLPLILGRGVVTGRLDTRKIILSANIEMLVRLLGAILLWQAGFGLIGVVAAMSLSIAAGWLPVRLGRARLSDWATARQVARDVGLLSLPFAALQGAQVILLDGDILIARHLFAAETAGLVAVLALFQRIQFYACFAMAGVLLPSVASEHAAGGRPLRPMRSVLALVLAVNLPILLAAATLPDMMIRLLSGPAFAAAAPALIWAALSAFLFTLSYILTTVLAAMGDRRGIWLMVAFVPLQLIAFALLPVQAGTAPVALVDLIATKALIQSTLTLLLASLFVARLARRFS